MATGGIPAVFRCLAHPSGDIRREAKRTIHSIGWDNVAAVITAFAAGADVKPISMILEGLAAFEAHPRVVSLLDGLVTHLHGDLRNRAILLLERKRLGLQLDQVAALFRELQSPYQIERALGQGLITEAYLARVEASELKVVLRVLRPEFVTQPHVRAQFFDLATQSLHFVHHNLALTREARAFPDRNIYYAVRDYVDGVTLQTLLESGKRFDRRQILEILSQVLAGLTPLHQRGLQHGGIKPSNIFVREGDHVILGDPSPVIQGVGLTLARLSYDYRYAAPETFCSGGLPGPHSDFYSLGCVAYELICGQPPFVSDNYLELAALHARGNVVAPALKGGSFQEAVDALLLRLLARSPADRFCKLGEVMTAFDQLRAQPAEAEFETGVLYRLSYPRASLLQPGSVARCEGAQSIVAFSQTEDPTLGVGPQATETTEAVPGRIGPYEVLGTIARGAMGVIYKAKHINLGRVVALKMIPRGMPNPLTQRRFYAEASIQARMTHRNIATIYEIGTHDGESYFAMRFAEGGDLARCLDRYLADRRAAVILVEKVARAVHHAHGLGVLHRDLKPGNILLDEVGEPLVADFGLAKFRETPAWEVKIDMEMTHVGQVLGTPFYMSPEQASGHSATAGPGSDIWSLGVILYRLLTGRLPFTGSSYLETMRLIKSQEPPRPRTLQPNLELALELICLKCLEKAPAERYASAAALADDLARWLQGAPIAARPRTLWSKLQRILLPKS